MPARLTTARPPRNTCASKLDRAYADNRQLAQLVASTELLIGAVVAASILDLPRALAADPAEAQAGAAKADRTLARIRRAIAAEAAAFSVGADAKVLAEHLTQLDRPGMCTAAHESLWIAYNLRPLIEREFADNYRALDAAMARDDLPCRWSPLREAWRERATQGRFVDPFQSVPTSEAARAAGAQMLASSFPGVDARDATAAEIGRALLAVSVRGAFARYDEAP